MHVQHISSHSPDCLTLHESTLAVLEVVGQMRAAVLLPITDGFIPVFMQTGGGLCSSSSHFFGWPNDNLIQATNKSKSI